MKLWFERGAWASRRGRVAIDQMQPQEVKRIAVIRHAALGDMVLVRPFLVEVRKFFPNAEIVLSLVSNYTYGAPVDLVDAVHVVHGSQEKNVSLRQRISRVKELGPVDILFDLANTTRSRYVCFFNQAHIKIGFPYKGYLRNLLLDAAVWRSDFVFEAETMLHTLMLLGANPKFPLDYAWPDELRQSSNAELDRSVVYFPFASVETKCWPTSHFYALIDQAAKRYPQTKHIVLEGVGSHEHTRAYQDLAQKYPNVLLQSKMSIENTTKMLANAALVVSNDTGIRNLAISLGTSTLGIFFSTVPFRYWPKLAGHEAVFLPDGTVPDVQSVLNRMRLFFEAS
jgi:ADP-heptose:LPS heptosyltransferase